MKEMVIKHNGEAFISIEVMLHVIDMMIATRDKAIEQNPDGEVLVPGSEAAAMFMRDVLKDTRSKFFAKEDLSEETEEMLEGIDEFLRGE